MLDHLNKSITSKRKNSIQNEIETKLDDVVFNWQNFMKKSIDCHNLNVVSENNKEVQEMLEVLFKSNSSILKK